MGEPQEPVLTDGARCGNCGGTIFPNAHPSGSAKIYCSRRCKNNAQHLRAYSEGRDARSPKFFNDLERRQKYAADWRDRAKGEGRCVRCGRDNDRKIEGRLICSNCIIDIKGGPT